MPETSLPAGLSSEAAKTIPRFSPTRLAAGGLLALALIVGLRGPLRLMGDAREYILQTQAIVLHGRLAIDRDVDAAYWNRTEPFALPIDPTRVNPGPKTLDQAPDFGGLYRDLRGSFRFYHFWGYSLAVAPLYAMLHLIGGSGLAYHAFRLMNLLFLFSPFVLAWRRRPGWPLLLSAILLLASPLMAYVDWAHPELYCFFLICLAFFLVEGSHARLAPLPLGLATAQNPPLIFLFPILWLFQSPRTRATRWNLLAGHLARIFHTSSTAASERRPSADFPSVGLLDVVSTTPAQPSVGKAAIQAPLSRLATNRCEICGLAGLALAFTPLLYNQLLFGTSNPIAAVGLADLRYASLARTFDLFTNPLSGALWIFPAVIPLFILGFSRENAWPRAGLLAAMLAMAWLAGSTANYHAGQIGASRYAVWILAAPAWLILVTPWEPPRPGWRRFATACALATAIIIPFRTWELLGKRIGHFGGTRRLRPETARLVSLLGYLGDPEVFVENIRGSELTVSWAFADIYLWELGTGRSLILIPHRALRRLTDLSWAGEALPVYRTSPPNAGLLRVRRGRVHLNPQRIGAWREHPRWGGYALIWVDGPLEEPTADVPIFKARTRH